MNTLRKTKIVATIGPSSSDEATLTKMIRSGMNVARINCSHGNREEYRIVIERIRKVAKKLKVPVAILLDLSGIKIRIGEFAGGKIVLEEGKPFTLTTTKTQGDERGVFVDYPKLPKEAKPGMHILLDDGKIVLEVVAASTKEIYTTVVTGGEIRSRRGVNIPGAFLSTETITPKDREDIAFGTDIKVDYIALSFVRTAKDITKLHEIITSHHAQAGVIAKIETQQAVEDIDAIIEHADGIMVARGDLAVEVPKEEVPLIQKTVIRKCNAAGKPVITATQMLDSMATHTTPTRAEVNDVANAIFDGTDAVMLSGESAIGIHPALAIATMSDIALRVEGSDLYKSDIMRLETLPKGTVDAVSSSVARIVRTENLFAIVALTESGFTARMVSRHKPIVPILVLTPVEDTYRKLVLSYGCYPTLIPAPIRTMKDALARSRKALTSEHFAEKGKHFMLVVGIPFGIHGETNTLSIQEA
jgi:pyruvate kinase